MRKKVVLDANAFYCWLGLTQNTKVNTEALKTYLFANKESVCLSNTAFYEITKKYLNFDGTIKDKNETIVSICKFLLQTNITIYGLEEFTDKGTDCKKLKTFTDDLIKSKKINDYDYFLDIEICSNSMLLYVLCNLIAYGFFCQHKYDANRALFEEVIELWFKIFLTEFLVFDEFNNIENFGKDINNSTNSIFEMRGKLTKALYDGQIIDGVKCVFDDYIRFKIIWFLIEYHKKSKSDCFKETIIAFANAESNVITIMFEQLEKAGKLTDAMSFFDSKNMTKTLNDMQKRHLDNLLKKFVINKAARFQNNDIEDVNYLGCKTDETLLLTFDKNIIKTIKQTDKGNYDFIQQFIVG